MVQGKIEVEWSFLPERYRQKDLFLEQNIATLSCYPQVVRTGLEGVPVVGQAHVKQHHVGGRHAHDRMLRH